jgi:hypothetical protein
MSHPRRRCWTLIQAGDQVLSGGKQLPVDKLYGFNSKTGLLESVSYVVSSQGTSLRVETLFSNWQTIQKQAVPGSITRLENGSPVFTFVAASAALSAAPTTKQ